MLLGSIDVDLALGLLHGAWQLGDIVRPAVEEK